MASISVGIRKSGSAVISALSFVSALQVAEAHASGSAPIATNPNALSAEQRLGGGGAFAYASSGVLTNQFSVMGKLGVHAGRAATAGFRHADGTPNPQAFDNWMNAAAPYSAFGIRPVFNLEYYGHYINMKPAIQVGSYQQWHDIGVALASRFRVNGTWAQQNHVANFGVAAIEAFNEPDLENLIPKQQYHDALAGLADGVHQVDPGIPVLPAGFATCNSANDSTVRGYAAAIADLLNSGRLDGIDLHTYYSQWYPISGGQHLYSAQNCFERIKRSGGITRDINFYSTEFDVNRVVKKNGMSVATDEATLGRQFLTAVWDNLGVVRASGGSASVMSLAWLLFQTQSADSANGMALQLSQYQPDARASAYRLVATLANGMKFSSLDPDAKGEFVLSGKNRTLYVWQDLPGWTNHFGSTYSFKTLPAGAKTLEIYGYDGLRASVDLTGKRSYLASGLRGDETYMFLIKTTS
jgi:hypothetical protein